MPTSAKIQAPTQSAAHRPGRFTRFALLTAACLLVAWLTWPDRAAVVLPLVLAFFLGIATWGMLDLPRGMWCEVVNRSESGRPEVALTYDDGPDPASTPQLLDLLRERGARATFFCVGRRSRAHPVLVRRIHAEGHDLGGHGDAHSPWSIFYSLRRMRAEIEAGQAALAEVTGERPRDFRPPYGHNTHRTARVAREEGLRIPGWEVRGIDLPGFDPERVARRVLSGVRAGSIVLLHDGDRRPEAVVAATAAILDGLEQRGLRPVGLSTLLAD